MVIAENIILPDQTPKFSHWNYFVQNAPFEDNLNSYTYVRWSTTK